MTSLSMSTGAMWPPRISQRIGQVGFWALYSPGQAKVKALIAGFGEVVPDVFCADFGGYGEGFGKRQAQFGKIHDEFECRGGHGLCSFRDAVIEVEVPLDNLHSPGRRAFYPLSHQMQATWTHQ